MLWGTFLYAHLYVATSHWYYIITGNQIHRFTYDVYFMSGYVVLLEKTVSVFLYTVLNNNIAI